MIDFTVQGKPEPAGSKKAYPVAGRCVVVDANPKAKSWQAEVRWQATEVFSYMVGGQPAIAPPLEGPLHVEFIFGMPRGKTVKREEPSVRPDLTKLIRAVEDACTGIVWKDDAQIVRQVASKVYTDGPGFARVIVHG